MQGPPLWPSLQTKQWINNAEDEENNTLFVDNGFVCCFGSSAHVSVCLLPEWQAEDVGVHWQLVEAHAVL